MTATNHAPVASQRRPQQGCRHDHLVLAIGTLVTLLALPAAGKDVPWSSQPVYTYQERQAFAAQMERYEADQAHRGRNRKEAACEHVEPSGLKQWFYEGYVNGTIQAPKGPDFVPVAPPAKATRPAHKRKSQLNRGLERPPNQVIRRISQ